MLLFLVLQICMVLGQQQIANQPGDIFLGGLFPVHKKSDNPRIPCGPIQGQRGIQRLEAMFFTLEEINNKQDLLPNITLGARIIDTCSRNTYAVEQSMDFIRASMHSFSCGQSDAEPVAAVIGGSYSSVSIQVANLLRLFKIPLVSYASTSAVLSDKTRFDYFARTVPPDNFQARAMADIVDYFNWTYVSTVASEGDYGEKGIEAFKDELTARNVCTAIEAKVPQSPNKQNFEKIVKDLIKNEARVVALFLRVEDATQLLSAAQRFNMIDSFVWLASDGWGNNPLPVKDTTNVSRGAITIELKSKKIPDFDTYFRARHPSNNTRNPWFNEFWESAHKCKFKPKENGSLCTGNETFPDFKQDNKLQFVYDTVYAVATALNKVLEEQCWLKEDRKTCMREFLRDGKTFYKHYLLNVSFEDRFGDVIEFDASGDGLGRYSVMNYRRNTETDKYEYVSVGEWTNGLTIRKDDIRWLDGRVEAPLSRCSPPCNIGEIKRIRDRSCCWICTPCKDFEYTVDEVTCRDCGEGRRPTENKSSCYDLPVQHMRWLSVYSLVPVAISCLGITLTSLVAVTFFLHIDTPIVKASGRELSFVLLAGFICNFLMTFFLLAKPTAFICTIRRFGVGFAFAVMYSSLLVKTNRISRIFDSALKSAKRPPFISPKSQLIITLILIGIQIACAGVWLFVSPPGIRHYNPGGRRNEVILKCRIEETSFLISLTYNMLLILICTVYAIMTRKIPENFNESKFIGFTMYTTCIIWLAFLPIYFGTLNNFQIQTTTLCVSISLSAYVALLCLFTPKIYIIIFHPEKNVRKLTMNSTTYKKSSNTTTNFPNHFSATGSDAGNTTDAERVKLKGKGGLTTETETDFGEKDSMASL